MFLFLETFREGEKGWYEYRLVLLGGIRWQKDSVEYLSVERWQAREIGGSSLETSQECAWVPVGPAWGGPVAKGAVEVEEEMRKCQDGYRNRIAEDRAISRNQ